jgi:hypothetical protein
MIALSIDPGGSGSASLFDGLKLIRVMSFPHTKDYWRDLYWWCLSFKPEVCHEERVGGWAGQGGKSQFTFGYHTGAPHAAVSICGVPFEPVEATWWQRRLGLPQHYEEPNREKRRRLCKKDQKAFCLARWPWLSEYDKRLPLADGSGNATPDIWQSVCIGYARALDAAGVPLGQLA